MLIVKRVIAVFCAAQKNANHPAHGERTKPEVKRKL